MVRSCGGAPAVEDLDRHLVDAVTVQVGRVLEVRRIGESEFAVGVDVEEPGILAAEREARGGTEDLIQPVAGDGRHQRRVPPTSRSALSPLPSEMMTGSSCLPASTVTLIVCLSTWPSSSATWTVTS